MRIRYLVCPGSRDISSRRGSCPPGGASAGARPRTRTHRRTGSENRDGSPKFSTNRINTGTTGTGTNKQTNTVLPEPELPGDDNRGPEPTF